MLLLPQHIYPNLVIEFYANMVNKEGHSASLLDTIVQGTRLYLSRAHIAQILCCRNDGGDVEMQNEFHWEEEDWNTDTGNARFNVDFKTTRREGKFNYWPIDFSHNIILSSTSLHIMRFQRRIGKMKLGIAMFIFLIR